MNRIRKFAPVSEVHQVGAGLGSVRILASLVVVDIAFTVLFVVSAVIWQTFDIRIDTFLDFNDHRGLASVWGYSQYGFAIVLFYVVFKETRNAGYLFLGAILLFLLMDDAGELHDKIAYMLGTKLNFGPLADMHPQNLGEPLVYLCMGLIVVALLVGAYRRFTTDDRQVFINFSWSIFMLAVFGAAIDVVHGVVGTFTGMSFFGDVIATALEDGGELVAVSFLVFVGLDRLLFLTAAANAEASRQVVGQDLKPVSASVR